MGIEGKEKEVVYMNEKPGKSMLFGSVSVASIVVLIVGSMVPTFLMATSPENVSVVNITKTWGIVVPDDYKTLYEAVAAAQPGDQIFVKAGRYSSGRGSFYTNPLSIRASGITICGEDKNTTIIDGRRLSTVICVYADSVTIQCFTITNIGLNSSLLYVNSDYNIINNNIFKTYDDYEGIEYGVVFYNANNNIFSNNSVSGAEYGVNLLNADDNNFSYNLIKETDHAVDVNGVLSVNLSKPGYIDRIYSDHCSNNRFTGNIIQNNRIGLTLAYSDGNVVLNNTFSSNNMNGLSLSSCKNNVVKYNKFIKDGLELFGSTVDHFKHDIVGNTANDKPIYYLYDKHDYTVPSDAGQIIIVGCSGITVENVVISEVPVAVLVAFSSDIYIKNCEFSYNGRGVYLYFSSRCRISNNNFIKNSRNAYFICLGLSQVRSNSWSRNYWENTLELKIGLFKHREKIHGRVIPKNSIRDNDRLRLGIRTRNIDRHPARTPYEI